MSASSAATTEATAGTEITKQTTLPRTSIDIVDQDVASKRESDLESQKTVVGELLPQRDLSVKDFMIEPKDTLVAQFPDGGYGWIVVMGSFTVHFFVLGINYTFGVFEEFYLVEVFPGTSTSTISFIGTLGTSFMLAIGMVSGRLADRFGYRTCIFSGSVILSVGLFLASFSTATWHLFLTQGILFGFGSSMAFFPAVSVPQHYFHRLRGFATGIAVSGSGIGGLVLSPLTRIVIEQLGWRWALRLSAIVSIVFLTASSIVLRPRLPSPPKGPLIEFSCFKNMQFVAMFFSSFIMTFGYLIPFFFMPAYTVSIGGTLAQGALLLALLNGSSAVGRIFIGYAADFMGRVNMLFVCTFLTGISVLAIWYNATSFGILLVFVLFYGFLAGGNISLTPVIAGEIFGIERIASLVGILYSSTALGNLVGAPIAGAIFDATGDTDYKPAILYCGIIMSAGGAFSLWLRIQRSQKFLDRV